MSAPPKYPHPLGGEPYYDDPTMAAPQAVDPRSPNLPSSAGFSDEDRATTAALLPRSFRSYVDFIPTPGTVSKRHPTYEPISLRFWIVSLGCLLLTLIGIVLEIARLISNDNNGFYVPPKNVFSFVSTQFLTSFFPSLLFAPLVLMIRAFDWAIRMWNPYLLLSRGNAPADETLLIIIWIFVTYNALKFKHQFILVSGFTVMGAVLFQPLAGSIFVVKDFAMSSPSTVQSISDVGLSPDIGDLFSFASSAVFINVLVFNDIGDPSFICGGWAIAEFEFPTTAYLNGTMGVNTTGIATETNCASASQISATSSTANATVVSATSIEGCSLEVTFNPNNADQQFGAVNVPNCGTNTTDVAFQPVFFWFWKTNPNNTAGIFCHPRIAVYDVTAFATLNNNSLSYVTIVDNYPKANNVSGAPLNGTAYNGIMFDTSADINVQSRANSIRTGIPNAIFRAAVQSASGLQGAYDMPDDCRCPAHATRPTSLYCVRHFFSFRASHSHLLTPCMSRPLPAHILAMTCISVAAVVFGLHFIHFRRRRDIYIPHYPGTIGSVVALTSHSGFGELLMPHDDQEGLSRALAPLRFCLDRRTGAIVVDNSAVPYVGDAPPQVTGNAMMMTDIKKGQRHQRIDSFEGATAVSQD
ncbi:hypothetical protein BJV74DRAFT_857216 [Russula compacta]|nr:hypothetical protein BJV74DRAFT_857216 [Russula compacta]